MAAAECLGREGLEDAQSAWDNMSKLCDKRGTPLWVNRQSFLEAATAAALAPTTASATPTATSTDAATSSPAATSPADRAASDNKEHVGLPKRAVVGIAIGAAVAGVLGTAALSMCLWRRSQQTKSEPHPTPNPGERHYHDMPIAVSPSEPSTNTICYTANRKSARGTSPSSGCYSPQELSAAQPGGQHGHVYPQSATRNETFMTRKQSQTRGGSGEICELDGSSAPVPVAFAGWWNGNGRKGGDDRE
ncbi:hypothetical protein E4U53_000496 [Claviceps sorghi]|nr:hypothetical protein E4U53_000496 [Claviceps sorghi]